MVPAAAFVWIFLATGVLGHAIAQLTPMISSGSDGSIRLQGTQVHLQTPSATCTASDVCLVGAVSTAQSTALSQVNAQAGSLQQLATRTVNSTGTLRGTTLSINIGRTTTSDQLVLRLTLQGCGSLYTLSATFFNNGTGLTAETSSSKGSTTDGTLVAFAQYVAFYTVFGLDNGASVALRAVVDASRLSTTCSSYSYNMQIESITGSYDAGFTFSTGTLVPVVLRATSADIEASSDVTNVLTGQVNTASTHISTLQSQLSATRSSLVVTQGNLATATSQIRTLETLTADYSTIREAILNLTNCHSQGLHPGPNNTCRPAVPTCAHPASLPPGVSSLVWQGDAVPGTVGTYVCMGAAYDSSIGATCLLNGTWTDTIPQCVPCPAGCSTCTSRQCTSCNSGWSLLSTGRCAQGDGTASSPFQNCAMSKLAGLPSGPYYLSTSNIVYRGYCMNDAGRGWANAYGGGWEIVHTQIGGTGLPTTAISNANLRSRPNVGSNSYVDLPWIADASVGNRTTQRSQMSAAWGHRSREVGVQWMKFMVKIQGNTPVGQDAIMAQFPASFGLSTLYTSGGRGCRAMPGPVQVSINGVVMGSTSWSVYFGGFNVGLANRDNDQCGQPSSNYLTTNTRTTFRRIDGGTTDNSMRHLFSYADTATGLSSSRCAYCCWGCSGWREVVVWGVRPTPPP